MYIFDSEDSKPQAKDYSSVLVVDRPASTYANEFEEELVEEDPEAIYLRQYVHIKDPAGKIHKFTDGKIDTCCNATRMLVSKDRIKKLGIQRHPLLEAEILLGVNGMIFKPTEFVYMKIRIPELGLPWTEVTAFVIEDRNIGILLGTKAIRKYGLLEKLLESERDGKEWMKICRRRYSSPGVAHAYPLFSHRTKGTSYPRVDR
jgi:hypothetical protein